MKLRGILKIRADAILRARRKERLTQTDFAKKVGVPPQALMRLEQLRFDVAHPEILEAHAVKVAAYIGVPVDQIMPAELAGVAMETKWERVQDVPTAALLEYNDRARRLALPSPLATLCDGEMSQWLAGAAMKSLTQVERDVVEMRFGLNGHCERTLEETGKVIGVTKERVRAIQNKALIKLRQSWEEDQDD